jgi:hypothetical protein
MGSILMLLEPSLRHAFAAAFTPRVELRDGRRLSARVSRPLDDERRTFAPTL